MVLPEVEPDVDPAVPVDVSFGLDTEVVVVVDLSAIGATGVTTLDRVVLDEVGGVATLLANVGDVLVVDELGVSTTLPGDFEPKLDPLEKLVVAPQPDLGVALAGPN